MFGFLFGNRGKQGAKYRFQESENHLSNQQVLTATVIVTANNKRVDASLSKNGKFYKLLLTEKSDRRSIRFEQMDFDSLEKIDRYLRSNTQFILSDFKCQKVEPIKRLYDESTFDPTIL